MKINVSIQETKFIAEFVTRVNSVCVQMRHAIRGVHALNTQLSRVIAERAIHHVIVMDGRSFGQSQWNLLLTS